MEQNLLSQDKTGKSCDFYKFGKLTDDEHCSDEEKIIPVSVKRAKLEESEQNVLSQDKTGKSIVIKMKNPFVTQTIEVMKQTEMLRSLIDTYSTKSGPSNYLLNPCQMIPEVNFPTENATDFVNDDKFNKPIWFIPPLNTRFAQGLPEHYSFINLEVCKASLRKAVCSQLRIAGFTDAVDSALILFADAIEEFVRNLLQHIHEIHANTPSLEKKSNVTVESLEKAYFLVTNVSLIQVHNYWRNLLARNRSEIAEYKSVFQEYDKLMKDSQDMQKQQFQEGNFLNILEVPHSNEVITSESHIQGSNNIGKPLLNVFENPSSSQIIT